MKVKTIRTLNQLLDTKPDYATFAVEAGLQGIPKAVINKFLSSHVFLMKVNNRAWMDRVRKKVKFVYEACKAREMSIESVLELLRKMSKSLPGFE